jgi:hypothetical protein
LAATARQSAALHKAFTAAPAASPPRPSDALRLIVTGGDARLALDGASGVNRYGCGPAPDPGVAPFGTWRA